MHADTPHAHTPRHAFPRAARRLTLAALLLSAWPVVHAQPSGDAIISDRVKRDAESPFRWIRIHSESEKKAEARKTAVATAPAPPAPPPPEARPAPAPAPVHVAAAPAPAPSRSAQARPTAPPPTIVAMATPTVPTSAAARTAAAAAPVAGPPAAEEPEDTAEGELIPIDKVDPEWDDDVLRQLRKGHVVVKFRVAEDGYLSRIQILESTNSKLIGPAMAAVMQWRFQPVAEPRVATVEFGFDIDAAFGRARTTTR